jgi:hypothetical protein
MNKFNDLVEAVLTHPDLEQMLKKSAAYFIFGRMHPPTAGHDFLIKTAKDFADKNGADFFLFLSPSQKKKESPVPYLTRLTTFNNNPSYKDINIVKNERITTPQHAAGYLHNVLKYPIVNIICGSDRKKFYEDTFATPMRDGTKVGVIGLGGERKLTGKIDPSDVSTVKGSKVRELAKNGDYEAFKQALPQGTTENDAKQLFDILQTNG